MHKQVIIARYKENINWIEQLDCDYVIYDKSGDVTNDDKHRIYLENHVQGREAHTYLYYIINNYDNLADYTCFVQGNPFDHCPNILDIIKNPPLINFTPLGNVCTIKIYDTNLLFIWGAQFIASKQCIQHLPLSFYQKSLELTDTNPYAGTHFEFMWMKIMGHNKYIKKETMRYLEQLRG